MWKSVKRLKIDEQFTWRFIWCQFNTCKKSIHKFAIKYLWCKVRVLEHPLLSSQNRLIFHDLPTPDRNSLILLWNMDKRAISCKKNYYLKIETLLEVVEQIRAPICLETWSYCLFLTSWDTIFVKYGRSDTQISSLIYY